MQVSEDQKLLREKVLHLGGGAGIERMENALSNTRNNFFKATENGSPITPLTTLMLSPSLDSPSSGTSDAVSNSMSSQKQNSVVRSLFRDGADSKELGPSLLSHSTSQLSRESLDIENVRIVNEYVHGQHLSFSDSSISAGEHKNNVMVCDFLVSNTYCVSLGNDFATCI